MASIADDIHAAVLAKLQGTSFAGITTANIKRKALPRVAEGIDALPAVFVCPAELDEEVEQVSFEGDLDITYPVLIVFVLPSNRDLATPAPQVQEWRQQVRTLFGSPTLAAVPSVWDIDVDPEPPLDHSALNKQYGVSPILLSVKSRESRS